MRKNNTSKTELPGRIARYLMLHGSFTDNISLLNGKTGIALFFYEYSRFTGKKNHKDFADELLREIYREINEHTPLNFRDGLCGIGWAIEYFLRNNYVEGDPDKVLEELDKRIVEWDVKRITDFSLEKGLCGIACYVVARLQNRVNKNIFLTRDYCNNLIAALDKNSEKDRETLELKEILLRIMNGEHIETFYNPLSNIINKTKYNAATLFEKPRPKGIADNGYAGTGLKSLPNPSDSESLKAPPSEGLRRLYIFNSTSRAANYGIGTYIDNLIEALKESGWNFGIIHLNAQGNEVEVTEKEGYKHISIPFPPSNRKDAHKYYNRNAVYLLRELISDGNNTEYVFHLNFNGSEVLIKNLKKKFHCKIISVIHYTDWSFALNGDFLKLKKIYAQDLKPLSPTDKNIVKGVRNDFKTLDRADRIICVSKHTLDTYMKLGGLKNRRVEVVNNALKDCYTPITENEKQVLQKKYHIGNREKVVLFAGRLDSVKGVNYLITGFKKILEKHPDARLFIAGDGNFNELMTDAASIWSKISFTGRIERKTLYELYTLADIGIVCSLHEEFGLVAIEMMMHGLPVIVTKTSGLDEIVEDTVSGLKVPVRTKKDIRLVDVKILVEKIDYLFENPDCAKTLGDNARKRFLEKYELSLFKEKMLKLYQSI